MKQQLLGELLIQSGHITEIQLSQVIAEQQKTGEKIGQVFKRLNLLTEQQLLNALLYQKNPIQLGKVLVDTGYITEVQLNIALLKQKTSNKKLGEILVELGYIHPTNIDVGLGLQKALVKFSLMMALTCGTCEASNVQLQWDANTESDLAGYMVYYAPYSSQLIGGRTIDVKVPVTAATITDLDQYTSYQFAVTAYNTLGQESEFSNVVTIDATPLPTDNIAPTVAIISPTNNIKVKGNIVINVNASDNTSVSRVDIYNGSTLLYVSNTTPYSFSWNTTTVSDGTYTLTAKAYDLSGNIGQSVNINVTVNNIPILPANMSGIKLVLN